MLQKREDILAITEATAKIVTVWSCHLIYCHTTQLLFCLGFDQGYKHSWSVDMKPKKDKGLCRNKRWVLIIKFELQSCDQYKPIFNRCYTFNILDCIQEGIFSIPHLIISLLLSYEMDRLEYHGDFPTCWKQLISKANIFIHFISPQKSKIKFSDPQLYEQFYKQQ